MLIVLPLLPISKVFTIPDIVLNTIFSNPLFFAHLLVISTKANLYLYKLIHRNTGIVMIVKQLSYISILLFYK